jgi:hypothetical protein
MKANAAPISVADYCHDYNNKKIIIHDEYQRKEGIWSPQARSFFIESILLEYPIPKLYLYARLDLKVRQTIKEIVDDQQRSQALAAVFNNKLRLSKGIDTEELRGLKYSEIPDEWQAKFLSYSLPIDQFSGVPEDEVREDFRRMNANNVPLNDEEQRNARYQGPFKWFIILIAEEYKEAFYKLRLLTRRDLIRMSDLRLYSELALTLDSGFQTVKGKQIDDLYRKYNGTFEAEDEFREKISYGLSYFLEHDSLHKSAFLRAHVFQSIALAAIALRYKPAFDKDAEESNTELAERLSRDRVPADVLANALEDPESFPALGDFIYASTQKTNVEATRVIRYLYFRASLMHFP